MKILYLTTTSIYSGGERVTLDIAEHMQRCGNEVLYCGLEGYNRIAVEARGVPFTAIPSFTIQQVRKIVQKYRPDVIHTMDYRASTYAAFTGAPFIAHLHNNPLWLRTYGRNTWAMLLFCLRAKRIITVSKSVMEEYVFGKLFAKKTVILPNIVDCAAVRAKALEMQSEFATETYDVAFIGRFSEPKQPLRFVEIFQMIQQRMPEAHAVMIGAGELGRSVCAAIESYHLADKIRLTDFVWNPFPILNRSRVVIMPSAWEGFGLTAVESMALGKPVLASRVGGLKEIVTEECGSFCVSNGDFAEAACTLLADEDLYRRQSQSAMQRAELYADIDGYRAKAEAVYAEL